MEIEGQCDDLQQVQCHLQTKELWDKFSEVGTENIITKSGRRMFPAVQVSFSGFSLEQRYAVLLDMVPFDDKTYRHSYHRSSWVVAGKADPPTPSRLFVHPESPFIGAHLTGRVVSFEDITKLKMDAQLFKGFQDPSTPTDFQRLVPLADPRYTVLDIKDDTPPPYPFADAAQQNTHTTVTPTSSPLAPIPTKGKFTAEYQKIVASQQQQPHQTTMDIIPTLSSHRQEHRICPHCEGRGTIITCRERGVCQYFWALILSCFVGCPICPIPSCYNK